MAQSKSERITRAFGKWGIIATAVFTLFGFVGGTLITRDTAEEARQEYLRQILLDATSEINYNLTLAWYTTDRHVNTTEPFPPLRNEAIWRLYYNAGQFWGPDSAATKQILKCLNEMDLINRYVPLQYGQYEITAISNEVPSTQELSLLVGNAPTAGMIILHERLVDSFQRRVAPVLSEIQSYISAKYQEYDDRP